MPTTLPTTGTMQGDINAGLITNGSYNPSAITPDSLNATTPTPIVTPTPTAPYPVLGLTTPAPVTPPITPTPAETEQSGLTSYLKGLYSSLVGKSADQIAANTKFGVDTIQTNINDLTAQLTGLKNEAAAIPLRFQQKTQNGAITTAGLSSEQNQALLENSIRALGVSTLLAASQGQLANATSLADKAVALKYDPIQEQIDATTKNLQLIKDDPTTSLEDKNRAQKQLDVQNANKEQLAIDKQNATDIWKVATDAASNGQSFKPSAQYKTLSTALMAISKAKTPTDAFKIAGDTGLAFKPVVAKTTKTTPTVDFNTAAKNLQAERIPANPLNSDGSLSVRYQKNLLNAGLSQANIDWMWNEIKGGTSFDAIRQAIRSGGSDPKILDTFVQTLQK